MRQTEDQRIFIYHEAGSGRYEVERKLLLLCQALETGDEKDLKAVVKQTVPSYCDAEKINRIAANAM